MKNSYFRPETRMHMPNSGGRFAHLDRARDTTQQILIERQRNLEESIYQEAHDSFQFPQNKLPHFLRLVIAETLQSVHPEYAYAAICIAASIATQGKIQINSPSGQKFNLNLIIDVVGPPGSGKSTTLSKFLAPIYEIDNIIADEKIEKNRELRRAQEKYKIEKKKLEKEYMKVSNDPEQEEIIADQIADLKEKLDIKPLPLSRIYTNNATRSGIISHIKENFGSLAAIIDEAPSFYRKVIGKEPGIFNDLYDGRQSSRSTQEQGNQFIQQIHFNILTSSQNGPTAKLNAIFGEVWLESGFTSRKLPVIVGDLKEPLLNDNDHSGETYLNEYLKRIKKIHSKYRNSKKEIITLSPRSIELLKSLTKSIKLENSLNYLTSFISRSEMHILKIACIFMLIRNSNSTTIESRDLLSAYYIFLYHLKMHDMLATKEYIYNINSIIYESSKVLDKITSRCNENNGFAELSWLQPRVSASRRTISSLQPILDYLIKTRKIRSSTKSNRTGFSLVTDTYQRSSQQR